jgi:hypothetical protein
LLVPIEAIIAGKSQLEKGIINAENDISHHNHQTAV